MKNDIEILKLFTRKLANCKYSVPADKLTQYLKEGSFGYTFDPKGDNLITNDSVFADEVATAIEHIRSIFNDPHITLKQEEVIRNVSVASEFDTRALSETMKDEKLWRVKLNKAMPEFVHTYVREDNLAIYENRFVCYLLDFIYELIKRKLNVLCNSLTTFNKKIDENGTVVSYSTNEYIGYTENIEEIPVLAEKTNPEIVAICTLFKTKSIIASLKSYEIYKACKKVGFDINSLKPTNILNCDKNYNYCYKFYLSYLRRQDLYTTQSVMYSQFALVNFMTAFTDCGFTFSKDSKDILINESAEMKAESIIMEKGIFRVVLSKNNFDIVADVTELSDFSHAQYLFKIVVGDEKKKLDNPAEYIASIDPESKYTKVFLVTDEERSSEDIIYVSVGEYATVKNLVKAVKSITMLLEGVEFIHNRYCPVCGSTLVAPDSGDYLCTTCSTLYHIFRFENRDMIWIKRLPAQDENKAQTNDKIVNENSAIAVTTVDADAQSFRKIIQKSFMGKMSQATKEQVGYYNELKNYLLSYKRVNSRISWYFDSFNIGREKAVKIAFRGQTMVAYFALDPAKYADTKYYPHDMGDKKKFEETPMMVKIKSDRGVKYAKELIDVVCEGLPRKKDFSPVVYKFTRMSDKKLLEVGLAKITYSKRPLSAMEMISTAPTNTIYMDGVAIEKLGEPVVNTRTAIQKSFTGKMSQATAEQIAYYNTLKNHLLSFKRVNSRVSWGCDSFNIGREKAVKIAFRGQTMVAYLALDPAKYIDTKYYFRDVSDKKKFADTPMMVKIKSERGVKYAIELINVICDGLKPKKDFAPTAYKFKRLSDKKLIENGLAKQVSVKF